jgi:hypothetical protein
MRATAYRRRGFGQLLPTQLIAAVPSASVTAATGDTPGTGAFWVKDSLGQTIDCNSWYNVANSACWGVAGGNTGTPLLTDTTGAPTGLPDCSYLENFLNGSCSVTDFLGLNKGGAVLTIGMVAIGLLALFVAVKALK